MFMYYSFAKLDYNNEWEMNFLLDRKMANAKTEG